MKNNIYKYLGASILLMGMVSCDESSWVPNSEEGTGSLEMTSISIEVNKSENVVTRATDVNNFLVTITDVNDKKVGNYVYGTMPEIITLPAGNGYKVTVESHEVKDAEWDNPYYKGSETFNIEKGKITKIGEVVAKFSSLKVSVKFGDELKKIMSPETKVTVKGNNGAELVYTTKEETKSGYFAFDGATTFAAHFYGFVNGVETKEETPFNNVKIGNHHILTYNVKEGPQIPEQSGEIASPDLDIDYKIFEDDIERQPDMGEDPLDPSDRPGQEEPQDPGNSDDPNDDNKDPENPDDPNNPEENPAIQFIYPKDSWLESGKIKYASDFNEYEKAYLEIKCIKNINNFWVKIESDDPDFEYSLVNDFNLKTEFDLADTSVENQDLLNTFQEMGFPTGNEVKGKNEVTFDISQFVGLLQFFKGVQTFILTVYDEEGNSLSDSIKIYGELN